MALYRAFPTGTGGGGGPGGPGPSFSLPIGQHGQTLFCDAPGSSTYIPDYTCKFMSVAETQEELDELLADIITQEQIFKTWYRFSHGPAFVYPYNPSELNMWQYVAASKTIRCTINSTSYIGFVSTSVHENYQMDVTFTSTDADDDLMAFVIAFIKDTDREYTLSAVRSPGGIYPYWALVYNYNQPDQKVLVNGSALDPQPAPNSGAGAWNKRPAGTRISCIRTPTKITLQTSRFNSTAFDPALDLSFDLSSDVDTKKFVGPCQYGFSCLSQNSSAFRINMFFDPNLVLAEFSSGGLWQYDFIAEKWVKNPTLTVADNGPVGNGKFVYSTYKGRLYYVKDGFLVKLFQAPELEFLIKAVAGEFLPRGSLVSIGSDQKAYLAMEKGKKAVGITIKDYLAGEEASIQFMGVFENYSFAPLTATDFNAGATYYQGDVGRPSLKTATVVYPAIIAITDKSALIIPAVGGGSGGGGGLSGQPIGIYVENVGVKRVVRSSKLTTVVSAIPPFYTPVTTYAVAPLLTQMTTFDDMMSEAFESNCWQLGMYMMKQYLIFKNTSSTSTARVVVQNSTVTEVDETVPPNTEMSFQIHFTDWKLLIQGEYEYTMVLEVVSNKIPLTVIDTDDTPSGGVVAAIDIVEEGTAKFVSVIMGQIRRFVIFEQEPMMGLNIPIFDFATWLASNVVSSDFLVNCSVSVKNNSSTYPASVTTAVSSETILPGDTVTFELFREDVQLSGAGDITVDIICQVTANAFP